MLKVLEERIPKETILLGYRGSVAYGTNTEDSDMDVIGVSISPIEHYFGLTQKDIYEDMFTGPRGKTWDMVVYELRRFVELLLKSNPNVLGLLWLPEHLYLRVSVAGRLLIGHRDIFVSKQAFHSFAGYANGQMHSLYKGIAKNAGAKRKKMIEKHGYDVKNAYHLIRLLRMGIEFLTDGELHIVREDVRDLIAIRNGEWSKEKVFTEAEKLFELAREAYIRSPLPPRPDKEKAEALLVRILREHFADTTNRGGNT